MDLVLITGVLLSFILLVPCIGLLRWLKKGSMFNKKILLAASAVYIILSVLAYVSYEIGVKEAILGLPPPEPTPYSGGGEHVRFLATSQFGIIFVGGILLGVCWVLTLKPKKAVALTVALMFGVLAFIPQASAGYWDTDKVIDVLGVADEEMNIMYPIGWERYLGWEIYIYDAYGKFMETFGLEFQLRGWISYDSDDGQHINYYMLQEAITETGFQFQETIYNGYHIDLLMVFTAQMMYDPQGYINEAFSYEDWNAMILYYYPSYPRTSFLMHEYTHQFYIEDGVDVPSPPGDPVGTCVMAVTGALGEPMPPQWGPHCIDLLNTNGYKWRFNRTYWVSGNGGGGGGGGCPFVSVWDGNNFVLDNNVLPTSKLGNGSDVEDYYRLEHAIRPYEGKYRLLLSEFQNEHSHIDQVRLLAVDHESDINVAVAPDGEILTYKNPFSPMSAVDGNGTDRLSQIRYVDGNLSDPSTYFQGNTNDSLLLNFGQLMSNTAKLIVRNDILCMDKCIWVQVLNSSGDWQTITVIASRAYWAVEGVNLSPYIIQGRDLMVRLFWTQPHKLDYVGLDTTRQDDYELRIGNLLSATHSAQGDVKALLTQSDNAYAELLPGQQIQLEFKLPNDSKPARTYIFHSEGHYYTLP